MPQLSPRILFAAPDESFTATLHQALSPLADNILAVNGLEMTPPDIIAYARASSIEVIVSRGGIAEFLREEQVDDADAIPVVSVQVSPFDIIDAIRKARQTSHRIAFIAYAGMLEGIQKITALFDIDVRLIYRSSPWDCVESVFNALENNAEIIIGDARVVKICRENAIPAVLLDSSEESIRQAYASALTITAARDNARREARLLSAILDQLPQGILALDDDGKVLYANAEAARMMEQGKRHLAGQTAARLPLFQKALFASLLHEPSGRASLTDRRQRAISALWQRLSAPVGGMAGIVTLDPRSSPAPASLQERGYEARFSFDDIVGHAATLRRAKHMAQKYAQTDATVLLQGETGTGKELFAHAIHLASPRHNQPFVAVNLAALPQTLVESELFGYVRGAFTDARRSGRQGVFESAGQGTVFLDEIGDMPLEMQSRLLRVLQEGEFSRLGDDRLLKARCRIIAATNQRLEDAVRQGRFRADLYYRLAVLRLDIPSLRERMEDMPELARHFLQRECARYGRIPGEITAGALRLLTERDWPGNIRELRALMERSVLLCEGSPVIMDETLLRAMLGSAPPNQPLHSLPEREAILEAMRQCGNNRNKAAALLGMHRSTLWRKLKNL